MSSCKSEIMISLWCILLLHGMSAQSAESAYPQGNASAFFTDRDAYIVDSKELVAMALANNPTLNIAENELKATHEKIQVAEGEYPWTLGAEAGATHSSAARGNSTYQTTNTLLGALFVDKTWSTGTTVELRTDGSRYDSANEDAAQTTNSATDGPYTGISARVTVTQPLLRGAGKRVGLSALRIAETEKTLKEKSNALLRSQTVKSILEAYWELWYALQQFHIEVAARDVAQKELEEITERVAAGDAAPSDRLSVESTLASFETNIVDIQGNILEQQLALANLAGVSSTHLMLRPDTQESIPENINAEALDSLLQRALHEAPSVQEAKAAKNVSAENVKIAGEDTRARLDISSWIQASTLTNTDMSLLAADLGKSGAYSAYVGLTYELPLDNRQKDGEQAMAKIEYENNAIQVRVAEDAVRRNVSTAWYAFRLAKERYHLAGKSAAIAEREAVAQRERFALGIAIYTEVRAAEENARTARLTAVRANVDMALKQIDLDHWTGQLLSRY